ncbi:MAG: hypothetical protein ACR2PX_12085, partial [Endozoicomonas sp.]|uniref:hypothetical protein n=1 Tax=Endozoicomonas sp. TaxID=1892382 RepID=UPI003D9B4223
MNLNAKSRKRLLSSAPWLNCLKLVEAASKLMSIIGEEEFCDFNRFKKRVDQALNSILQFLAFDEGRFLWTAEPVYYCDSCAKPSEVQSTSQQQAG